MSATILIADDEPNILISLEGADACMTKPFAAKDLVQKVKDLLDQPR